MTIQNVLDWLQEAEDNNCWQVSTQSVKRHLEEVQKQQLILYGVSQQRELLLAYEKSKYDTTWWMSEQQVKDEIDDFLANNCE